MLGIVRARLQKPLQDSSICAHGDGNSRAFPPQKDELIAAYQSWFDHNAYENIKGTFCQEGNRLANFVEPTGYWLIDEVLSRIAARWPKSGKRAEAAE